MTVKCVPLINYNKRYINEFKVPIYFLNLGTYMYS